MDADLGSATVIALLALAAVGLVLLLVGALISLLVRLTAEAPVVASTAASDEQALRARAAAAAVAVALAQRGAATSSRAEPSGLSPWQIAMRTAGLTRWRPRR